MEMSPAIDLSKAVKPNQPHPHAPISDPPLGTLIAGVLSVCLVSAYFLYDTYSVRQQATQTTKNGRAYVARLLDPPPGMSTIKFDRLARAVTLTKDEATLLKTAIASRAAQGQLTQTEIREAAEQVVQIERDVADLKQAIEVLR